VFGAAIDAASTFPGVMIDVDAELGSDHHLSSKRRERLSDQFPVCKWAMGIGRVEEGHTTVYGSPNESDQLLLI
jgi:hypothetical protein